MLEPAYGEGVDEDLDLIENDESKSALWNAVINTLQFICDNPTSAQARRNAIRYPSGRTAWRVPIRCPSEDENWSTVWYQDDGEAVFTYVGVWPPPPGRK